MTLTGFGEMKGYREEKSERNREREGERAKERNELDRQETFEYC